MAAFPSFQQHHHPFLLDSSVNFPLPNTPSTINNNKLLDEPNNATSIYFSQFVQNLDHSTKIPAPSNNEASVLSVAANKNISMDNNINNNNNSSSIVTADIQTSKQQRLSPMEKKRKSKQGSSSNSTQSKDMREARGKKQKKIKNYEGKKEEEAPTGYIHVRARRGQATDSHSLAERVRRERISERMKLLQALVPGCDKVTGKALMLDEIINYVQSLQNQVEFLSMKLASVNPMFYDFGMELESFMVRPDQDLSSLPSPPQSMQQCNYPLHDINSVNSLLFQQAQFPSDLISTQVNRQMLWEADDQRQKIINQSGFNTTLFSFH